MASLKEIRDGLAATIKKNVSTTLQTYSMVEDIVNLPCIMVEPVAADFEGAFQQGMHTWDFNLFVLVSRSASASNGQKLLDQLISGAGQNSIVQILHDHSDLGLAADGSTDAECYMLKGYGGSFDWAKIQHVGAILKIRVITDPR